jgi:hypothetical protein
MNTSNEQIYRLQLMCKDMPFFSDCVSFYYHDQHRLEADTCSFQRFKITTIIMNKTIASETKATYVVQHCYKRDISHVMVRQVFEDNKITDEESCSHLVTLSDIGCLCTDLLFL